MGAALTRRIVIAPLISKYCKWIVNALCMYSHSTHEENKSSPFRFMLETRKVLKWLKKQLLLRDPQRHCCLRTCMHFKAINNINVACLVFLLTFWRDVEGFHKCPILFKGKSGFFRHTGKSNGLLTRCSPWVLTHQVLGCSPAASPSHTSLSILGGEVA